MSLADHIEAAIAELTVIDEGEVSAVAWENVDTALTNLRSALRSLPLIFGHIEHLKDKIGIEGDRPKVTT